VRSSTCTSARERVRPLETLGRGAIARRHLVPRALAPKRLMIGRSPSAKVPAIYTQAATTEVQHLQ
jgi:hypothetical protein